MKTNYFCIALAIVMLLFCKSQVLAQKEYKELRKHYWSLDHKERVMPKIPEKGKKMRVIIDTDAANEIDDLWAVALAVLSPERFKIEGFVVSNFHNGGPNSIDASYNELLHLLDKAGLKNKYPVYKGGQPMLYEYLPSESEGVDFIIKTAMESSQEDPIWVIALGSATNIASAYLKEPAISEKVVFFWHGRTAWPVKCTNFNVFGDRWAASILFNLPVPLVLFDTGTHLTCPMEESLKNIRPHGEFGKYLHDYRLKNPYYQKPTKGFFDLGDIAALFDPEMAQWQETSCPSVGPDLSYHFKGNKGNIMRCYYIDKDKTYAVFYDKLKKYHGGK